MNPSTKIIILVSIVVLVIAFTVMATAIGLHLAKREEPKIDLSDVNTPEILSKHTEYLARKEIIKVTDGVYVAIGYALANSIMIEAPDGLIIVDTTESLTGAREIVKEFKKRANKPVRAVLSTHFHTDHNYGIKGFLETEEDGKIDIWTYKSQREVSITEAIIRPILNQRSRRQFGVHLTANRGYQNSGIGLRTNFDEHYTAEQLMPTKTFSEPEEKVTIAGLEIVLLHVPGETPDQMAVWVPSKRVLCPADNYYHTFPNIYTIRGTPVRNIVNWIKSVDLMRALNAAHMVPSHTYPESGEKLIQEQLTNYRDAMQLVHDQTVRYINKGFHPDKIVKTVHLPPNLVDKPYLGELYGMVGWSVRSVFSEYLGWFSGYVQDLQPIPIEEKAPLLIDLAGGTDKVLKAGHDALEAKNYKWALELSTNLLTVDVNNVEAREIRYKALKGVAGLITSPNGRNYYLSTILEDWKLATHNNTLEKHQEMLMNLPVEVLMQHIAVAMKSDECFDKDIIGIFKFTDETQILTYEMHMRHGIIDHQNKNVTNGNFTLTTTLPIWKATLIAQHGFKSAEGVAGITVDDKDSLIPVFFNCLDEGLGLYD